MSDHSLPPKLEAVLVRLAKSATLNVTQAVKLPYLVDVIANRVLGHRITEGTHQAWDHGVVTAEAWRYLTEDSSKVHLESVPFSEERRVVADANARPEAELSPEEQQVVDFVVQEYGGCKAGELGRMTKLMNPQISSWRSNRPPNEEEDAYDRMSYDYQEMAETASGLTVEKLERDSILVEDLEDAIA